MLHGANRRRSRLERRSPRKVAASIGGPIDAAITLQDCFECAELTGTEGQRSFWNAGSILFAGASGACGRLTANEVSRFKTRDDRDYYAIAMFRGRIFVGAGRRGLETVEGNAIVPFKENIFSYKLTANDEFLSLRASPRSRVTTARAGWP